MWIADGVRYSIQTELLRCLDMQLKWLFIIVEKTGSHRLYCCSWGRFSLYGRKNHLSLVTVWTGFFSWWVSLKTLSLEESRSITIVCPRFTALIHLFTCTWWWWWWWWWWFWVNILAKAELFFKDESIKVTMCNVPLFYKSNSLCFFITSLKM